MEIEKKAFASKTFQCLLCYEKQMVAIFKKFDEHTNTYFSQDTQATQALAFNVLHSNIQKYIVSTTKKVGNK